MDTRLRIASVLALGFLAVDAAQANIRPDKVYVAENKKSAHYIDDGLITGGDRAIDEVEVKDVRRAKNKGFDRWVIDLDGTRRGEPTAIGRPPFYQIALNQDEKRMVVTIFGNPRLGFNSQKVVAQLKKSTGVSNVELLPKVEDDSWTFAVSFKEPRPIEVFELNNPVRIIIDLKAN